MIFIGKGVLASFSVLKRGSYLRYNGSPYKAPTNLSIYRMFYFKSFILNMIQAERITYQSKLLKQLSTFLYSIGNKKCFIFPLTRKSRAYLNQIVPYNDNGSVPLSPCVVQRVNNVQQLNSNTEIEVAIFSYHRECFCLVYDLTSVDNGSFHEWKV